MDEGRIGMSRGDARRLDAEGKARRHDIRYGLNVTPTWWPKRSMDEEIVGLAVVAVRRKWPGVQVRVTADKLHGVVALLPGEDAPAAEVIAQRDELRREIEALA